jgi:hypothetical protein
MKKKFNTNEAGLKKKNKKDLKKSSGFITSTGYDLSKKSNNAIYFPRKKHK